MYDDHTDQLQRDLTLIRQRLDRRRLLALMAGALTVACVGDAGSGDTEEPVDPVTCDEGNPIPGETAGPYPGDGSNGVNALAMSGIVRQDITSDLDGAVTAAGVPLTFELQIVDADGCTPLAGAAVYLWHCDQDGDYSLYTVVDRSYLRGVQVTDSEGKVTFRSIFPGCYDGRWPHVHFEVYPDLASTSSASNARTTSQLALPSAACDTVYAEAGYEASVDNFARITLGSDNVFSDGVDQQMATVSGDVSNGFTATLVVPV